MLDSKEQVQQHLPIPLPKAKFRSPGDSNEETEEDDPAATPSAGDLEDDGSEVPLVRLSPSATKLMLLPHGLMPIRTSLRSTGFP